MSFIYTSVVVLLGISALATFVVVGRGALRRAMSHKLLKQAGEVRQLLDGLRERNYKGIDKLLFDMRDSYDLTVIEDELRSLLGSDSKMTGEAMRKAFDLLGLTERYMKNLRDAGAWQTRARSATALGQLADPRAVPALLETMRDVREDSDVKLASAEALGHIRDTSILPELCEQLGNVDEWASPRLAKVITGFGEEATEALLHSLDAAPNLNARIWSAQVLGKIRDRRATMALAKRLHDRSEQMRISVANALGDIADNRAFRPLIDVILRDPVAAVRSQAATSLGRIGDEGALPLLVNSLGDPESWMRFRALEAIEALAPSDTSPIENALSDTNLEVRHRAALALERLGVLENAFEDLVSQDPEKEQNARSRLIAVGRVGLSERLARHLDDKNVFMRERIASLLGPVGDSGHTVDLLRHLEDESEEVRFAAIESLGDLAHASACEPLIKLLTHADSMHRKQAVSALIRFPSDVLTEQLSVLLALGGSESDEERYVALQVLSIAPGKEVDQLLRDGLRDRYVEVRVFAAKALGERGSTEAIDELGLCLGDPDDRLRTAAATSLGEIGGERAINLLLGAMPRTSGEQRDSICATLASLGYDSVRPLLDVLMASDDTKTRLGAIWTLGKTGDPRAAKLLRLMLFEEETLLRSSAAGALGKIACQDSVLGLLSGLEDPSPFVRSAAVNGLGKIGSQAQFGVLTAMLRDPDPFVRDRSAVTIGRIGGDLAHDIIVGAASGALDPALRVIALGLTGSAKGIGEPLQAMKDPILRHEVSAALEREEEAIRVVFFSNLRPKPLTDESRTSSDANLEPDAIIEQFLEALRNSKGSDTRRRAASALGSMQDADAIEALALALARDPDAEVRKLCAAGLAKRADDAMAKTALLKAIVDPQPDVRLLAIEAVGNIAAPSEAAPIFESLRSEQDALVETSEESLAKIYAGHVEGIHDWMMGQEGLAMQACGLRILRRIGDARSLGLIQALLRSKHPDLRVESARALVSLQVPDAIRAMLEALGDPKESVRVGILKALEGTTRADVVQKLQESCFDPSVVVRAQLTITLSTLDSAKAVEILATLANDTDVNIAGGALLGLLRNPDEEGLHKLLEALPTASADARRILRRESDTAMTRVAEQIRSALDADSRTLGVKVLAAVDATRYATEIAEALGDPDAQVRLAATAALAELEPERVGDWLKALLDDPVAEVRDAAKRALFRIF
ncbi:MAG: hypothetical protein GY811_02065 [Myxococcales bacterium]|nr:hypothetical protein [Myxococcales bacterium]